MLGRGHATNYESAIFPCPSKLLRAALVNSPDPSLLPVVGLNCQTSFINTPDLVCQPILSLPHLHPGQSLNNFVLQSGDRSQEVTLIGKEPYLVAGWLLANTLFNSSPLSSLHHGKEINISSPTLFIPFLVPHVEFQSDFLLFK